MQEFGTLKRIKLRDAWRMEHSDFTPWLSQEQNLQLLTDAINIPLVLVDTEKPIGVLRADIVAKNPMTDQLVVIENQLDRTDHLHLGQVLTYASGISAATVIWIAEVFADEHRSALTWLNEITADTVNFFGIELEAWKIGNSPIAPKFNLVVQPNGWTKEIKSYVRQKPSVGAGRQSTALDYAIKWLTWEQANFTNDKCPWANPRAFRSRRPKLQHEIQAREILGLSPIDETV